MERGVYITDRDGESYGNFFRSERILYQGRSRYQDILVFDTKEAGRVMMLDNIFNVSESMEAFYHEPMAHIPLAMGEGDQEVLIIGGGDFALARQVLKHSFVTGLTLCELDPEILTICRRWFPEWAACESDQRLRVRVGDGFDYLDACPEASIDALLIDSTDPYLFESPLISEAFYAKSARALKPGGVMMQIIADFLFYKKTWFEVIPLVAPYFSVLKPLAIPIPFYATGSWGFLLAGKGRTDLDPERVSADYLKSIPGLKTLTPEGVKGWFCLPPYLREEFGDLPGL
ncbi:MAG: hypothetical protein ACOC3W_11005 [Thermodesulfobacteriota bacterium]